MSYILDALKKSEQEKTLGQVPTLETVVQNGAGHRSSSISRWPVLLAVLLAVFAGAGIFYKTGLFDRLFTSRTETVLPHDPALENPPVETAPQTPPVASGQEPKTQPANQLPSTITPSASIQDDLIPLPVQEPASPAPALEAEVSLPVETGTLPEAPVELSEANVSGSPDQPQPVPETAPDPEAVPETAPPPGAAGQPGQDGSAPEYETVLADPLRNISVNVVTWSSRPRQRFTMLDLTIYKEGDTIPNGAFIVEIIPTGVVVEFQGQRYLLKP